MKGYWTGSNYMGWVIDHWMKFENDREYRDYILDMFRG